MCDDDWVKFAMSDDSAVVDILLRLHHPPPPPPPINLHWTVRQPRSRSVPKHHNNKADSTRASPTTPLSWSGATSASGGAVDGYEESSQPTKLTETSRSKVVNSSGTANTKKSRRKKTLAELKEEENLLLKERKSLKNELSSLRLTVEKHRATNESLKRMKLDFESGQNTSTATASEDPEKAVCRPSQITETICHQTDSVSTKTVTHENLEDNSPVDAANSTSSSPEIGKPEANTFVLPDLNLPVEEDYSPISLH